MEKNESFANKLAKIRLLGADDKGTEHLFELAEKKLRKEKVKEGVLFLEKNIKPFLKTIEQNYENNCLNTNMSDNYKVEGTKKAPSLILTAWDENKKTDLFIQLSVSFMTYNPALMELNINDKGSIPLNRRQTDHDLGEINDEYIGYITVKKTSPNNAREYEFNPDWEKLLEEHVLKWIKEDSLKPIKESPDLFMGNLEDLKRFLVDDFDI